MKFKVYLKQLLSLGVLAILCVELNAQDLRTIWKDASVAEFSEKCYMESLPSKYRVLELDLVAIKKQLNKAVYDSDPNAFVNGPEISLPLPEGGFGRFRVARSEVLPDNTTPSYSNVIRTFTAYGIDDKFAVAKFDYTIFGFHALVMTPSGWFVIEPYSLSNSSHYISFYRKDKTTQSDFTCETESGKIQKVNPYQSSSSSVNRTSGANLKTYRLALSCTGEYAAVFGGTQAGALSAMVTSVNRVTGVYELELSVRLVLVANTNLLIYTNATTDPFTNTNGSTMLGQNQTIVTSTIGSTNYDIGHVFSTGGGGVAGLGVVCNTSNKARGVTGSGSPFGDGFDIDYVAHEMGHQFSGNHSFNGALGSCTGGNRNGSTAYEPGSGTTIMAYAGICGTDNTAAHSDAIFHAVNLDEILTFVTTGGGSSCPTSTATGNTAPVVSVPGNYTIPYLTPFSLTGSATDVNGDALTYIWEEYDLGAQAQVGATQVAANEFPLFRDFTPQTTGTRIFPQISDIVNNTSTIGERLPSVARTLKFRFTARDNRLNGGAISNNDTPISLTVIATPDTFLVKQPNTALSWPATSTQTVLWDVSGTSSAPINCANVNIYLSTDGGFTYPITLATGVPNNGSANITVPGTLTTTARVKVEGAGNIFFDISNVNFSIVAGSSVLTTLSTLPLGSTFLCAGGSSFNVSFSGDGPANFGNIYTAQLSTVGGAFPGTTIGTLSSTATSGTISCSILAGTTPGSIYRIRVISSTPAISGSNNGTNLTVQQAVGAAGGVTGTATVCAGQNSVAYSVAAITNATTYNWTLPSGATIASGAGTNSILVNFGAGSVSGTVTVAGANACFTGTTSLAFSVTVNPLPTALSAISGSVTCVGQTVAFSVSSNPTAVTYNWTLTGGGTIATGNGTNSITANFPSASSGTLSVSGVNSCGNGIASTLPINLIAQPASPTISAGGPTAICTSGNVSLSFTSVGGNLYQWRKNGALIGATTTSPLVANTAGSYDLASWTPQTYSTSVPVSIPDNLCAGGVASPISISGYAGTVTSSGITISINITHTFDGDLILSLRAPNGQMLALTRNTGGSGVNFTNTVFTDAAATVITSGTAPFTGSFRPIATTASTCTTTTIATFALIGAGAINPNGTWNLIAIDNASQDVGTIDNWSITIPSSTNAPCYGMSNSIAVTVTPAPAITTFSPSTGSSGQTVAINGSGFTGATMVNFNGISATFSVVNDGLINATVPAGSTTGLISVITPCGTANSLSNFSSEITLNLKVFIEGFYSAANTMRSPLGSSNCDTIEVRLASSGSPYAIMYTVKGVISTSGNGLFTFPGSALGNSYYIIVKHRNSLETWSGSAIPFPSTSNSFDFTTLASQAFGGNQVLVSAGKWAIRSGDVNQDGAINTSDYSSLQTTISSFVVGYQVKDLTGDNCLESTDYSLVETNSQLNLILQKP